MATKVKDRPPAEDGGAVDAPAAGSTVVIARADLLRAAAVASIVESKQTIPILANMLIEAKGDEAALTATDLDIVVRVAVPAQVAGGGFATTVAAKKLAGLVGTAADGCEVRLTHAAGGRDLDLRAARGRYKLPVLPREDFPIAAFADGEHRLIFPAATLHTALSRTADAESDEEARYYLNGTLLAEADGRLVAAATNGHMLAEVDMGEAPEGWPRSILPSKLTALIVRLLKDVKGDVTVTLDVSGQRIRFKWDAWTVTSKLVMGDFPDWRRVIPAPIDGRSLVVDSADLRGAIARVTQLASEKTRKVVLDIGADRVTVTCASAENGTGEEDVPASVAIGDIRIGVNAAYLRDIAAAASDDSVAFQIADDPKAPIRVEPQPPGGFVGVLMPMNV